MVEVIIESERGIPMSELDFAVRFWVYSNRRIEFKKEDLRSVRSYGVYHYYACVDSTKIGSGRLMAQAIIKEPDCVCGEGREVIISALTPVYIGGKGCPVGRRSEAFDEGYMLTVRPVKDIPKPDDYDVYAGIIRDEIDSMEEINEDMILSSDNKMSPYNINGELRIGITGVNSGEKVIVAIAKNSTYKAYKDDGFGGRWEFSENILGANGNIVIPIKGNDYRLYGEMSLVSGDINIVLTNK